MKYKLMGYCHKCNRYRKLNQLFRHLYCDECLERIYLNISLIVFLVLWISVFLLLVAYIIKEGDLHHVNSTIMHTIQQNINV